MSTPQKIIAHGTLGENSDTLFIASNHVLLIDAQFDVDLKLLGKQVSTAGKMGIPPSAPGITKLLVDTIVPADAIAVRAFEIYKSGKGGSQLDNWLRAERVLLHF
jgi:hypothetical protein